MNILKIRFFPCFIIFFLISWQAHTQVVLENLDFKIVFDSKGNAVSLIYKASGEECLKQGISLPAFSVLQYRPYDNENMLTWVTRPTRFPANSLTKKGDTLFVGFDHLDYMAVISIKSKNHYIGFTLEYFLRKKKHLGVDLETHIDEITFLQLPVKDRRYFGYWLDVSWDNKISVSLLATDVSTYVDDDPENGFHIMRAGSMRDVRLNHTGAALLVTSTDKLLDCIDQVEKDFGLPRGVESRRDNKCMYSYYECRNVTPENIDEHIRFARIGGFRMMVIYYTDFASTMGHFLWRKEYPGGMKDLKYITNKIRKAGMIPGFHIHYNKAQINDPYVTPVPDPRLNLRKIFTLAEPLKDTSTIITVEENPLDITLYEGRRLLKAGNEIIEYSAYTTKSPYQFTGCKRGYLNTQSSDYPKGYKVGLLDVDNWPIFIRFDQRTSIQKEVAKKIEVFVKEAGFRFIYFDGAEDVNRPYWYNVSLSMDKVYAILEPKPLFCEGACKTHFNWHILSRGNAFDTFIPEEIKEAVNKRYIPAAIYNAENFTGVNFGWIKYTPPGTGTTGIQPDMISYIASHAAGWDCPLSLLGDIDNFKTHPRTKDNLSVFRNWENAKLSGYFSKEQKKEMKKPGKEFILLTDKKGKYELHECHRIKDIPLKNIRAYLFEKDGRKWVRYWHTSGEVQLKLLVDPSHVIFYGNKMEKKEVPRSKEYVILPAGDIRYLSFDLPERNVKEIFQEARILNSIR